MKAGRFLFKTMLVSILFFGCKKNAPLSNYWVVNGITYHAANVYWISQFGFVAEDAHYNNIIINFYSDSVSSGKYTVASSTVTPDRLAQTSCTISGYLLFKPGFGSVGKSGDFINYSTPLTKEGFTAVFNNITVTDSLNNVYTISGNLKLH
ncbi:MAG TPA: hypothetical protein VNV85_12195 [Puia sp.]|jgi:hypothetical protein|nr:hypothetical protein [Puia sp.]